MNSLSREQFARAYQDQASSEKKRKHKYNAQSVTIDGIKFPSKAEGKYYALLKIREKAGEVYDVKRQEPYALTINGNLIATYKPDFVFYDDKEKRTRVVDVKGVQTDIFKLKRKLMKAIHGIEVELA